MAGTSSFCKINHAIFQYEKNQVTKKGDVTYYVCSEIRSGCQAKATVQRTESIDEEKQIEKKLVAVSKPMVNVIVGISKIQCFSRSMPDVTCQRMPILADKLVIKMKEEIKPNPVLASSYGWSYMENTKMNP